MLFLTPSWCVKENALYAKLRTVFNSSAKDLNTISINDLMHTGANLLPDLAELLIHWRMYRYVLVSGIRQMFRQILVH